MKVRGIAVVLGAMLFSVAGLAVGDDKAVNQVVLTGTVVDAESKPIAGAEVTACTLTFTDGPKSTHLSTATTKADGKFVVLVPELERDYEGEWCVIAARKAGLAIGWVSWYIQGGRGGDRNIVLGEAATINGVVVDRANKPISGAKVVGIFMLPDTKYLCPQCLLGIEPMPWGRTTTDARGRFRFSDVPSDAKAAVMVTATTGEMSFVPEGWGDPKGPKFTPGGDAIRITMPPRAAISGTVVDKKTNRVVDDVTLLIDEIGTPYGLVPTRTVKVKEGKFTVGKLPAGRYRISPVASQGPAPHWIVTSGPITVRADQEITDAKVELLPGGIVEVAVTDAETGTPLPEALVHLAPSEADSNASELQAGITGKDGLTRFRVLPGRYHLGYVTGGRTYVHRVFSRPDTTLQRTAEEGKTVRIDAVLDRKLRITGVVRDKAGKLVQGATVSTVLSFGDRPAQTGEDGTFELWVTDWKDGTAAGLILVRQAEGKLAAFAEIPTSLKTEITLVPATSVSGRVVGPEGKPFAEAKVQLCIGTDRLMMVIVPNITTNADGHYTIGDLPVGPKCKVTISAPGYGLQHHEWAMESVALKMADTVMLPADELIEGVVVDHNGRPSADVTVAAYSDGMEYRPKAATTDASGRFEIKNLPKGEVTLTAHRADLIAHAFVQAGDRNVKIVLRKQSSDQ